MATKAAAKKTARSAAPEVAMPEAGGFIKFLGYGKDVAKADRVLTKGDVYEIAEIGEGKPGDADFGIAVWFPNPDFDGEKEPNDDDNQEYVTIDIVESEFELTEAPAEEEPAEETPVAAKKAAKGKAEAAPATKKAAAKKTAKAAEPEEGDDAGEDGDTPDLDGENEEVLAMVDGADADTLLATAQELEAAQAKSEFQLGGVLYHFKKSGLFKKIEKGAYAGEGGWAEFIPAYFTMQYRKAQHLLNIYVTFTQLGLTEEQFTGMGWSKASKIVKYLPNLTEAKQAKLVKEATENTVEGLSEIITDKYKTGGTKGDDGETVVRKTLRFRFLEEQGKLVEDTLTVAKDQLGLKDEGEALLAIVTEWGQQHAGTKPAGKTATSRPVGAKTAKPTARKVAA